jgi:hypothetical protein
MYRYLKDLMLERLPKTDRDSLVDYNKLANAILDEGAMAGPAPEYVVAGYLEQIAKTLSQKSN